MKENEDVQHHPGCFQKGIQKSKKVVPKKF